MGCPTSQCRWDHSHHNHFSCMPDHDSDITCCAFPSATSWKYSASLGARAGPAGWGCPATAASGAASGAGAESGWGCLGAGMNSAGCTIGARALASAVLAPYLTLSCPLHAHDKLRTWKAQSTLNRGIHCGAIRACSLPE